MPNPEPQRVKVEYPCPRCGFGVPFEFLKEEMERAGIRKDSVCTHCGVDMAVVTSGRPVVIQDTQSNEYKSGRFAIGKSKKERN